MLTYFQVGIIWRLNQEYKNEYEDLIIEVEFKKK